MSATKTQSENIVEVKNLKKYFPITAGIFQRVIGHIKAVDDVSFVIPRGKTVGLVGESGCGKTTISKCILRAVDPTSGEINLHTEGQINNVADMREKDLRPLRREMQMIF